MLNATLGATDAIDDIVAFASDIYHANMVLSSEVSGDFPTDICPGAIYILQCFSGHLWRTHKILTT